jgi:geranylgeranyl diphosphate synthase type II
MRHFQEFYAAGAERYSALLHERLRLDAGLHDVAVYALASGKRVRPLLVEFVGTALGAEPYVLTEIAVAIEYLHTASVLLDDLPCMDNAARRRGMLAAHLQFSQAEVILSAVALLSRSYELLLATPVKASSAMARLACETVAGAMAGGQAMEFGRTQNDSPETVRRIHERKTASLFRLGGQLAAACADASPIVTERVVNFTTIFGRVFQIVDDIEDRDMPGEERSSLSRLVGTEQARAEARMLLDTARRAVTELDATGLMRGCADWLESRLNAAS